MKNYTHPSSDHHQGEQPLLAHSRPVVILEVAEETRAEAAVTPVGAAVTPVVARPMIDITRIQESFNSTIITLNKNNSSELNGSFYLLICNIFLNYPASLNIHNIYRI